MSLWTDLAARLRSFVLRGREEREMEEEMRFHLEMEAAEAERSGLSPEAARRHARLSFGAADGVREDVRDARGTRLLEDVLRDVRQGWRSLWRAPVFSLVVVTLLALGIGATSSIFGVLDRVLLRPLPFAEPARLVVVWQTDRASGTVREPASLPDYEDYVASMRTLRSVGMVMGANLDFVAGGADPERVNGLGVSGHHFDLLGVEPVQGRSLTPADAVPGAPSVAVLSDAFWRSRLQSDPAVLGRKIELSGEAHTVVGIMPAAAGFGTAALHARADYHAAFAGGDDVDVWLPLRVTAADYPRETHPFLLIGRLADGATIAAAQSELDGVATRLEDEFATNANRGVHVEALDDVVFAPIRPALTALVGAVGFVLLIVCANVTSLLLARTRTRLREIAVRATLGAGASRLARQFFVENLLLALLGGAAGIALAGGALRILVALVPADLPRADSVAIDQRVLFVALGLSVLIAALLALVPLVHARRFDVQSTLRAAGRGVSGDVRGVRLRSALVVTQLALSVVLATGALLLVRSVDALRDVDPGFRSADVVKLEYQLPETRYPRDFGVWPEWTATHAFTDALLDDVRALPGVEAAAIAGAHPLDAGFTNSFAVVGREAEAADWPEISLRMVSPSYFATMAVPVLRGRAFDARDDGAAARVMTVNTAAAERFFAGRDPIGAQIRMWGTTWNVIAVVGDERFHGLRADNSPAVYVTLRQAPSATGTLLVRTTSPASAVLPALRAAVRRVDPALATYGAEPLRATLAASIGQERFVATLLAAFALLATVLAGLGIYGLLNYTVAQRATELGVRSALGARPGELLALVLGNAARLAMIGCVLGLAGAIAGVRLLESMVFGVNSRDPVMLLGVVTGVALLALLASVAPALRAVGTDPLDALRAD